MSLINSHPFYRARRSSGRWIPALRGAQPARPLSIRSRHGGFLLVQLMVACAGDGPGLLYGAREAPMGSGSAAAALRSLAVGHIGELA